MNLEMKIPENYLLSEVPPVTPDEVIMKNICLLVRGVNLCPIGVAAVNTYWRGGLLYLFREIKRESDWSIFQSC